MITYWEDMEEGDEGRKHEVQPEEGGGRRRSKRVSELCERFEEGEEGRSSQSGGSDGRWEEKHTSSVSFISFRKNKNDILYLTKLPVSKFSKL